MGEQAIPVDAHGGILSMMTGSGPVVQGVLFVLILLSVWSWAITIQKILQFKKIKQYSDSFMDIFWETQNLNRIDDSARKLEASPLARMFVAGYRELVHLAEDIQKNGRRSELDLESIERSLRRTEINESARLDKGVTFLATVASAAPFIGLFGTVWGIMTAFHGLGDAKSSTLQAVAPGISEALVATAIGLAAAIPAAIAYNYFAVMLRRFRQSMEGFRVEFLNYVKKAYDK